MGPGRGDPSGGGAPDAAGEPDPAEFELVVELDDEFDDERLAEGGEPNCAASGFETIDGDDAVPSLIARLPRGLQIAGALAVAVVLAFVVWPTTGARRATPQPNPPPSQVDADLYKVRLSTTSLTDDDSVDHAVLGLELTNGSATRLSVVSAELWDAVGTRIGSATAWPAQALNGGTTVSVPVTLPYGCDGQPLPVLPVTIRYSVSTPQDPNVRRDYAYPLSDTLWDDYTRQQTAICAGPGAVAGNSGSAFAVTAIDTTQPIGAPADPQGFDLTFTIEAAGIATWNVQDPASRQTGVTITASGLPVVVTPGQTARLATHWHVTDCTHPPAWNGGMGGVEITGQMAGSGPGNSGSSEQTSLAALRPGLVTEMMQVACGTG
ncbi:hypothetical protein KGQ20_20730 [Catenulispora sp. NF23]|uniref:DUF4232 domain-containing protein n=1 Tax=Catenulispora pinistramenti TaxID=2705254 RepID=A0ABS5KT55_9ACTN|nr:hypothetical protein [Catenulispora pinistramenti]MBS2535192.1 hypothetical protein [Catenulispora pinistramenti]MBS2549190.1 hypothetical protein [Catenulispora pinistramenti]